MAVDFQTMFGLLSLLTTCSLYSSALPGSLRARKTGILPYDPTVSVVALINCFMWVVYAAMLGDVWIFFGNLYGVAMGAFNTFIAIRYSKDETLVARLEIIFVMGMWLVAMAAMCLVSDTFIASVNLRSSIASTLCLSICITMFAAPLLQALEAIKKRDVSQINGFLTMTQLVNGSLWCAYGALTMNLTVISPNGVSVILALVNLAVKGTLSGTSSPGVSSMQTPLLLDGAPFDIEKDSVNAVLTEALHLGRPILLHSSRYGGRFMSLPAVAEESPAYARGGSKGTPLHLVSAKGDRAESQVQIKTLDGRFLKFRKTAGDGVKCSDAGVVAERCSDPGPEGRFLLVSDGEDDGLALYNPSTRAFLRINDHDNFEFSAPSSSVILRKGDKSERFALKVAAENDKIPNDNSAGVLSCASTEADECYQSP